MANIEALKEKLATVPDNLKHYMTPEVEKLNRWLDSGKADGSANTIKQRKSVDPAGQEIALWDEV